MKLDAVDAGRDEQSPRRDRRGDGRGARTDRLLAQYQGAARLLVRALRLGAARLVAQAAHIPVHLGSTPLFGARRDRAARFAPRRRGRAQRSLRRRYASAGPDRRRADFLRPRAPSLRVRRQPRASRGYRRDGAGLDGALDRDLPGGFPAAAGEDSRGGGDLARRAGAVLRQHPRAARSARATCARRLPR